MLEVNKSIGAVEERCSSARLSLDLYYEKMKIECLKSLDDYYNAQTDIIEKSKKEDLDNLMNLQGHLKVDLHRIDELMQKGIFQKFYSDFS